MPSVFLTVHGVPQPAGSKKVVPAGRHYRVIDANKKSMPWKAQVARAACETYKGPLLRGPLHITLAFFQPRPGGHYGAGRNSQRLRPSAPSYPTVKPDIDKLSRAVLDGLTGVLYKDDSQIITKVATKSYGEPARVEIVIHELETITLPSPPPNGQLALVS